MKSIFQSRITPLFASLVVTLVFGGGCNADSIIGLEPGGACVADSNCEIGLCIVGVCVEPSAENLERVDIEIRPPEGSGWLPQQVFAVPLGEATRAPFQLLPTAVFHGNILDDDGGSVSARVLAIPESAILGRTLLRVAVTDDTTGAFELEGVSQQQYRIVISPNDTSVATYTLPQVVTAGPLAGEVDLGEIRMPAVSSLITLSGRVVAGVGIGALGIPSLEVRVFDGKRRVSSVGVTDIAGDFTVHLSQGQTEGRSLDVEVRPTEENALFPVVKMSDFSFDVDTVLPTIELGAAVTSPVPVSGRVIGPDSTSVRQATVYASATLGPGELHLVTTTDDAGAYSFDLPPGDWHFSARAPSTDSTAGFLLEQEIAIVGPTYSQNLVVAPRVSAAGHVISARNVAVANATLRLIRTGPPGGGASDIGIADLGWSFVTTTGDQGNWTAAIDPGRYRLTVSPPTGEGLPDFTRLIDVFTDPPDIDVILPPAAHLAGKVLSPTGTAVGAYGQIRVFTPFVVEGGESLQLGSDETLEDGTFGVVIPDLTWTGIPDGPDGEPAPEQAPPEPDAPEPDPGSP